MYSRLPINKHHTSTRLACFRLSIGFRRPIATIDFQLGFAEPFSPTWAKEGKTVLWFLYGNVKKLYLIVSLRTYFVVVEMSMFVPFSRH